MDIGSLAKGSPFGPNDVVLLMDTSFLIAYSNANLWATYVRLKVQKIAQDKGKVFNYFINANNIEEYERFWKNRSANRDTNIPLAHSSLDELLNITGHIQFSSDEVAANLAVDAWNESYSGHSNLSNSTGRRGPGYADINLNETAIKIANLGSEVYVASYDFRDIIGPLRTKKKEFEQSGLSITPLPPDDIELKYFEGTGRYLRAAITDDVRGRLQTVYDTENSFTFVIFERNIKVKKGDAVFFAGVDITQLEDLNLILPKEASGIKGNARGFPVVRVPSFFNGQSTVEILRGAWKRYVGMALVVVDQENPYFPLLVYPSDPTDPSWYRPFSTTLDFLYHQTYSSYARDNFRPNHRRLSARR